ncbi:4557_t:CDS:10, partial [Acaulospora colombiana]
EKSSKHKGTQVNRDNDALEKISDLGSSWEIDDEIDLFSQPPRKSTFYQSFQGHTDWVNDIILCHNNETLISASSDRTLKLWHPQRSNSPSTIGYHTDYIKTLSYARGPGWLETFYAGSKDGLVTKTDYSGCAEIRDGECAAVCKEDAGVVKTTNTYGQQHSIPASKDGYMSVSLCISESTISKDVSLRRECRVRTSSTSPISPPPSPIPSSALIKLTSTGVAMDSEIATLHSVIMDDMENLDNEDSVPVRSVPDYVLEGQHGLIKHCILNNRRHILTVDSSGEVALWDIIRCVRIETYGKRDIEEVASEINTIESIPNWCSVDTRIGALTVHLDENRCFDAEMYADEDKSIDNANLREDQRINLGKWVLRNLFATFTKAEIQEYEELQHILRQYGEQNKPESRISPQHISFPPATLHSGQLNNTDSTSSSIYQKTIDTLTSSSSPQSPLTKSPTTMTALPPTTPQAAFTTGPFTAPATTGTSQADYFSGSHHNSPTSPTGASGSLTPPGTAGSETLGGTLSTAEVIKPPPPALVNQPSGGNATSNSFMGLIKGFSRKASRSNTDTKLEGSTESYTGTKSGDSKLTVSTQPIEEDTPNSNLRKDDDATVNSAGESTSQVNIQSQQTDNSGFSTQPIRQFHHLIQPPFYPHPTNDTPEIQIPPHTTVIISEETPEASAYVDLYRGTVGSLGRDVEIIDKNAPNWLIEFLIKNKVSQKEQTKIGFILKPHDGSDLNDLPNG